MFAENFLITRNNNNNNAYYLCDIERVVPSTVTFRCLADVHSI